MLCDHAFLVGGDDEHARGQEAGKTLHDGLTQGGGVFADASGKDDGVGAAHGHRHGRHVLGDFEREIRKGKMRARVLAFQKGFDIVADPRQALRPAFL